jgi:cell division protein FtsQ
MTTMEPRLAERRKGVSEDHARGRLKWVLVALVVLLAIVGGVWLLTSPILSLRTVTVSGNDRSNPMAAVIALEMGQGTPTIEVDTAALEASILEDPWVKAATIDIDWPGSLSILVVEHRPFATVRAASGWVSVSQDGAVLEAAAPPTDQMFTVAVDAGPIAAGYDITNPMIIGALQFIGSLDPDIATGVVIETNGEGLEATVVGHVVRLGRPTEMHSKARVLSSLIASGLEPGAGIDVIAPLRPAVTNPQPEVELEQ